MWCAPRTRTKPFRDSFSYPSGNGEKFGVISVHGSHVFVGPSGRECYGSLSALALSFIEMRAIIVIEDMVIGSV